MTPKVPKQDGLPRVGPPPVATGGWGLPPKAVPATSSGGLSDEAFRDHAIIAIYAGKVAWGDWGQACMESACRDADALLAERNRRRDERQKGGA